MIQQLDNTRDGTRTTRQLQYDNIQYQKQAEVLKYIHWQQNDGNKDLPFR